MMIFVILGFLRPRASMAVDWLQKQPAWIGGMRLRGRGRHPGGKRAWARHQSFRCRPAGVPGDPRGGAGGLEHGRSGAVAAADDAGDAELFLRGIDPQHQPGVRNLVSDVELLKGELAESWEEGDLQYATAYLQWRAIDYLARLGRSPGDPDWLVSGDPRTPVEATEMWTFVRRRGGQWLLSAIQQI